MRFCEYCNCDMFSFGATHGDQCAWRTGLFPAANARCVRCKEPMDTYVLAVCPEGASDVAEAICVGCAVAAVVF